ncbi:MAG: hypothetical protein AAF942_17875, partial [Pseudomonadota bacterium]
MTREKRREILCGRRATTGARSAGLGLLRLGRIYYCAGFEHICRTKLSLPIAKQQSGHGNKILNPNDKMQRVVGESTANGKILLPCQAEITRSRHGFGKSR